MPKTLTSLPAELRIQIYALALTFPRPLTLLDSKTRVTPPKPSQSTSESTSQTEPTTPIDPSTQAQSQIQRINLSLLRLNKSISAETIPIFYAHNRFILPQPQLHSDPHSSSPCPSTPIPTSPIQKHAAYIRQLLVTFTPPTPRPTLFSPLSPPFASPAFPSPSPPSIPPPSIPPPSTPAIFQYLESLLQGWESHIHSFLIAAEGDRYGDGDEEGQMTQLRCLDIDAKSLIELVWAVRGYEWDLVRGVIEGFRPIVGGILERVMRREDGKGKKRRCKVRVLFTRGWWCVGVYEDMFREVWGGLGVEVMDVDRVV